MRRRGRPAAHSRRIAGEGRTDPCGEMVEWFKASVLKTDEGQPSGGSNPPLSAIFVPGGRASTAAAPGSARARRTVSFFLSSLFSKIPSFFPRKREGRIRVTLRWGRLRRLGKLACARLFCLTAGRERHGETLDRMMRTARCMSAGRERQGGCVCDIGHIGLIRPIFEERNSGLFTLRFCFALHSFPSLVLGRGMIVFVFSPVLKIIRKKVLRNAKKHLIFLQLHVN